MLAKALISARIITDRTKRVYAEWANMKHLESKGHDISIDAVVIEGIEVLRRVNANRKVIKQKF